MSKNTSDPNVTTPDAAPASSSAPVDEEAEAKKKAAARAATNAAEDEAARKAAEGKRTVEAWAAEKKTPAWVVNATRVRLHWPVGALLSETAYDEACKATQEIELR